MGENSAPIISKSTLNYLRKNAKESESFRVYEKIAARLE